MAAAIAAAILFEINSYLSLDLGHGVESAIALTPIQKLGAAQKWAATPNKAGAPQSGSTPLSAFRRRPPLGGGDGQSGKRGIEFPDSVTPDNSCDWTANSSGAQIQSGDSRLPECGLRDYAFRRRTRFYWKSPQPP
jgi:hypothetical protein